MLCLRALLLVVLALPCILYAQNAKVAIAATNKTFDLKASPASPAQNQVIIKSLLATLDAHPDGTGPVDLVRQAYEYAEKIDRKEKLAVINDWFTQNRLTLLDLLYKEGLPPGKISSYYALDAALATSQARVSRSKEYLSAARDKIDALAKKPQSARFIPDREMAYYNTLKLYSPDLANKFLNSLAQHANAVLAERATDELAIAELKKTPFDLTFTDHKGKPFNIAKLRGKGAPILILFWSAKNDNTLKILERYVAMLETNPDLFIIGINMDDEDSRPAALAGIKKYRCDWPNFIEGVGMESSVAKRLNYRKNSGGVILNTKGFYFMPFNGPGEVAAALKLKRSPPPPE